MNELPLRCLVSLTTSKDFGLDGASVSVKDAFSANIVSLLQAGCFFGSLIAAPVGDKLGRRLALGLGDIAFIVGSIMQTASAGNKAMMFVGRAIGGVVSIFMAFKSHSTPRSQ